MLLYFQVQEYMRNKGGCIWPTFQATSCQTDVVFNFYFDTLIQICNSQHFKEPCNSKDVNQDANLTCNFMCAQKI